jgi:hypothetical protein
MSRKSPPTSVDVFSSAPQLIIQLRCQLRLQVAVRRMKSTTTINRRLKSLSKYLNDDGKIDFDGTSADFFQRTTTAKNPQLRQVAFSGIGRRLLKAVSFYEALYR